MLDIAIEAAKEGGKIALSYFKNTPKIVYKPDKSPVTEADIKAEKAIRAIISKHYPSHGIIGEEGDHLNEKSEYQWVIDPIDGTKSFIRQIPTWGTLLALLKDNEPIIGIYFAPATDELFSTEKGKGTFLNGTRIKVSNVKKLEDASIVHGSIHYLEKINKLKQLSTLSKSASGKYGTSDCNGINMLLKGQVDVYLSGHGYIWDYAAPAILTEEAGGKFSDLNGQFNLKNDVALFSNALLHKQVLNILNAK